jgi:hypothetical protein
MQASKLSRSPMFALGQWLMVLPATLFLGAAALRFLQPQQYEPAHTSWVIVEWTTTHISRLGAGILFIVLPGLVVGIGCATLLGAWHQEQDLREDAAAVFALLRRQRVIAALTSAMLIAGAILAVVLAHVITD